jgi:hypothetical protein
MLRDDAEPRSLRLTSWEAAAAIGKPLTEIFHIASTENQQAEYEPARRPLVNEHILGQVNHTTIVSAM